MNVSDLPNPYDFANPVRDRAAFVGREDLLKEIDYYLGQAARAERPMNLALLGPRASGKTSVLNMVDAAAQARDLAVVRVDLDESDADTQLMFFYKLFDGILTTACERGAFGGITARTFQTYLQIVNAYEIPTDELFSPFLFPLQYANAMKAQNLGAPLSDAGFRRDLRTICAEVKRPIVILVDEGNVLASRRTHLEKLRNLFMNTPGFMLVITGTAELFPIMDEVFSPIVRQFKRISIGPFETREETEELIRKPLETVGISDPREVFAFETYRDVAEIHDLSGGKPYEIQLLCHFLFKRMQEGRAAKMELTVDVLDDVRRQLETSQDLSARPVVRAVTQLMPPQLIALNALVKCVGRAGLEQMWFAEYVFNGAGRLTRESMRDSLKRFIADGVLGLSDDAMILFRGDDFDRIYCKYYARKQGVTVSVEDLAFEPYLSRRLQQHVHNHYVHDANSPFEHPRREAPEPLIRARFSGVAPDELARIAVLFFDDTADPFGDSEGIAETLYWMLRTFRAVDSVPVVCLRIDSPWGTVVETFAPAKPALIAECALTSLPEFFMRAHERAVSLEGGVALEMRDLAVPAAESLEKKVLQTRNEAARRALAAGHHRAAHAYTRSRDAKVAQVDAQTAYRYGDRTLAHLNVYGYLCLVTGDPSRAKDLLLEALEAGGSAADLALVRYNLSIALVQLGDLNGALEQLRLVNAMKVEHPCRCLIVPESAEQASLTFVERWGDLDLFEIAEEALRVLDAYQPPPRD